LGASDTPVIDGESSYSTGIDLVTDGGAAAVSALHPVHGGETGRHDESVPRAHP
jgi:hypothetical protein